MAIQPLPQIQVITHNGKDYTIERNPEANKGSLEHVVKYGKTLAGIFNIFFLFEKVSRLALEIFKRMGSSLKNVCEKRAREFLVAWSMLSIPRLPEVTRNAIQATQGLRGERQTGDKLQSLHDVADAAAAWCNSIGILLADVAWKQASSIPGLISDSTDMVMMAQDWDLARHACKKAENGPEDLKQALADTVRHSFLGTMKAVCAVVGGILGLSALVVGGPLLPTIALVTLSLATVIFAIAKDLYGASRPFKQVQFLTSRP